MLSFTKSRLSFDKEGIAGKTLIKTLFFLLLLTQICFGQWVQTDGPCSCTVSALAVSGTNIFACDWGEGVVLSTNNGTSWTTVNNGLTETYVKAFAVLGSGLFAGTWGGVFLTTNNGASWIEVNKGLTNTEVYSLAISGTNIFAGTWSGVFLSTNNGTSWTAANNGLTDTIVTTLAVSDNNLFAGTSYGGVFLSTNNGTSWTAVNNGLTDTRVTALAVSDNNLFAGTSYGGVFLSTNNGTSWTPANTPFSGFSQMVQMGNYLFAGTGNGVFLSTNNGTSWTFTGLTTFFVESLAVSGSSLFVGTYGGGVFLSTNNGTNWTSVYNGSMNPEITALAVSPNGIGGINLFAAAIYYFTEVVFLSTNNGTTWTPAYTPFGLFYQMVILGENLFAGTCWEGVFLSTNNGTSWTAVNNGLTNTDVHSLSVSGSNLFAGTRGGVFLSTNSGTSWVAANNGLTNIDVHSLAVSSTKLFAGTDGGVFLSTNNGTNWTLVNTPFSGFSQIVTLGENLFAGTERGVFLSNNSGINWTAINDGLTNTEVNALVILGTNLFASTGGGGVFLYNNNATSWTAVNDGLSNTDVTALAVSGINLFAGTKASGVWRRSLAEMVPVELTSFTASANGKEVTLSWKTATELNNQGFEVQRKFGGNDFVTVGSVKGHSTTTSPNQYSYVDKLVDPGKYFYRLKQIDYGGTFEYSSEIEVEVRVLDKFTLEQNYPNPFNPTTKIKYSIPNVILSEAKNLKDLSSQVPRNDNLTVQFKVYDVLGNEVATLVNEYKPAGSYEVEFNADKLSSGVYFYQLKAADFINTKKMMLLR